MCFINVAVSQSVLFHGSKVLWNTTDYNNRTEFNNAFILLKASPIWNTLNHPPIYSTYQYPSIVVCHCNCIPRMLTNRSQPKAVIMASLGSHFALQLPANVNSGSLDNGSNSATGNSQCGNYTNQYDLPNGYGYHHSQQPFPGFP